MTADTTALPEGFTRGCLAGLSESERAEKVAKFASKATVADTETAVQILAGQAIRHEPVDSFETILAERSVEELRVMALDYGLPQQTVERIGHDDVITMIASAARADKRDCELAFESCSPEQRASLRKLLDAGGRIEFDIDDAANYADIRVFPPYSFLYIHEDHFTYLVCDVFLENLKAVDQKKTDAARKTVEDIVTTCSALVELCGVVESHTAYDFFKRWYTEDDVEFAEFARDVVREAATQHYDFVCWNDGVHDYLLHFSLEDPVATDEDTEADDAARLSLAEYRAQLIERHETIPPFDCGRNAAEQGIVEWKQGLPEVVALRKFLDAHIPQGENEYVFADRVIEELLFSSAASLDSQRALAFLNDKGLGPVLKADDELVTLVTDLMRSLPSWDHNGYAPHGERAYTASAANKTTDAAGNAVKVGRNDPCPCGSGKKYKKCCGANK